MKQDRLLVMTTCDDRGQAGRLAAELVERRLAACVNIVDGISSVYRWEGKIERGQETLLLIKTTENRYAAVEQLIKAQSSYELPEVLAVLIRAGSPEYLDWLDASVDVRLKE